MQPKKAVVAFCPFLLAATLTAQAPPPAPTAPATPSASTAPAGPRNRAAAPPPTVVAGIPVN